MYDKTKKSTKGKRLSHQPCVYVNGVLVPVLRSQSEVAKILGCSQYMISLIERKALEKLTKGLRPYK